MKPAAAQISYSAWESESSSSTVSQSVKRFLDALTISLHRTLPPGTALRAGVDRAEGTFFGVDVGVFPRFVGVGTSNAAVEWRFAAQQECVDGTQTTVDLLWLYQWPASARLTLSSTQDDGEDDSTDDTVCDVENPYLAYKLVELLVPRLLNSVIYRPRA